MKSLVLVLATIAVLVTVQQIANGQTLPKMPTIAEDETIICIKDVSDTVNRNSMICHIFALDNVDWYQELSEPNYGKFGSLDNSFEMGLVD